MADGNKVYVVPATLEAWKTKLGTVNSEALDVIKEFREETNSIDNYLRGEFSDSYVEMVNSLMDSAINSHNSMKNIEVLIQNVVNTVEKE